MLSVVFFSLLLCCFDSPIVDNNAPVLTPWLQVLVYNGQLDVILAGPMCENFLRTIEWSGQSKYLEAERVIWKVPGDSDVRAVLVLLCCC